MIPEEPKKFIVERYKGLCKKYKVQNWQKQIWFENGVDIMYKMNQKLEKLEKKVKELEDR